MSLSGLSGQQVHTVQAQQQQVNELSSQVNEIQEIQNIFIEFIRSYSAENFKYKNQLLGNYQNARFFLQLWIEDLAVVDIYQIKDKLMQNPSKIMPLFESAIKIVLQSFNCILPNDFQIELLSEQHPQQIRELEAKLQGQLVIVEGIILSSSKPGVKAQVVCIKCKNCENVQFLNVPKGISGVTIPRRCQSSNQESSCPLDPYIIIPMNSQCINTQLLKLQELPENIPTGEMPRTIQL